MSGVNGRNLRRLSYADVAEGWVFGREFEVDADGRLLGLTNEERLIAAAMLTSKRLCAVGNTLHAILDELKRQNRPRPKPSPPGPPSKADRERASRERALAAYIRAGGQPAAADAEPPPPVEKVPVSPTPLLSGETGGEWKRRWAEWWEASRRAARVAVKRLTWPSGGSKSTVRHAVERRAMQAGMRWEPETELRYHHYMPPDDLAPHLDRIRNADAGALLRAELADRREGSKIRAYVAAVMEANGIE